MVEVAGDQLSHRLRQLSLFLPNRLGALLSVTRALDAAKIRVCALAIVDSADHAVARLVVDQPTLAAEVLKTEGYSLVETDLLGVVLSQGIGLRKVLTAMIAGEVNIHYLYSLLPLQDGGAVLALHVDDVEGAARVLSEKGLRLLSQDDLKAAS